MRRIFALSILLFINACGFEPVYGTHTGSGATVPSLASVRIENIPDREGQLLRMALEDRFNPQSVAVAPKYSLKIALKKVIVPVIVRTDGSIERYNINLNSHFVLQQLADGKDVFSGELNRISSSNVSDADFASYVTKEDAIKRSLDEMAEDYKFRLAGWLGAH